MTKNVVTIFPEASMAEASRAMGSMRIGSLIVEDQDKPIGIVTERDLLSKVIAKGKDPDEITVKEVMSSPLISIGPDIQIKEAAKTMISEKGRLAVFQNEILVGVVTASDLIKSLPESDETLMKVDDFMTKKVVMVSSSTTVEEVAKIMGDQRIGSVIVTKRRKPFGIFTERDLLTTFLTRGKSLRTNVGSASSSPLITIPSGTSIHETALTMALKHIRRLPIMEKGKIVGIITARDLVEAYAK
jgi:CBS domain-containing protein